MARKATTKRAPAKAPAKAMTKRAPAAAKRGRPKARAKSGYKFIETQRRKGVFEVTLDRPEVLNAINEEMAVEIIDAMSAVETDRRVKAVILQGKGRAFCAGADLSGFRRQRSARCGLFPRTVPGFAGRQETTPAVP